MESPFWLLFLINQIVKSIQRIPLTNSSLIFFVDVAGNREMEFERLNVRRTEGQATTERTIGSRWTFCLEKRFEIVDWKTTHPPFANSLKLLERTYYSFRNCNWWSYAADVQLFCLSLAAYLSRLAIFVSGSEPVK